jgi:hypothetical protein
VDIDLDTLKTEILQYLEASGFAIFRSHPGELEGLPLVCWDCERFPDYRMFLETAQKVNARLILFAGREFEAVEIEEELEGLEDCDLTRADRREYERRLREFRKHEGVTCSLELGFDHNSRLYVYEVRPDWYDEFLELSDEIAASLPKHGEDGEEGGSGMGGFYSNN